MLWLEQMYFIKGTVQVAVQTGGDDIHLWFICMCLWITTGTSSLLIPFNMSPARQPVLKWETAWAETPVLAWCTSEEIIPLFFDKKSNSFSLPLFWMHLETWAEKKSESVFRRKLGRGKLCSICQEKKNPRTSLCGNELSLSVKWTLRQKGD